VIPDVLDAFFGQLEVLAQEHGLRHRARKKKIDVISQLPQAKG
jgi:hypothetical protein